MGRHLQLFQPARAGWDVVSELKKIDPFDVEALEKAVNDSATRVSAIWISFLVFSLYLLIAATTVTQRQLLLAEPVKLPVLNIDLPQWGFFFLAPILFVILHVYVLLQVLLLGRTTAAYNTAVGRVDLSPEENALLRQRLANTLFAQIFAGSPRERGGFIGSLLRAIVWITLAIGPILILLAFQFSFLAYHSHIATWTHRLLILFELVAFFLIWPLALDARKDFQWPNVGTDLKRVMLMPLELFGPGQRENGLWFRTRIIPFSACFAFVVVSLSVGTFPGEPHVNLFTGQSLLSAQCDRWIQRKLKTVDLRFDRLDLPYINVVDDDKLKRIKQMALERKSFSWEGERTQHFQNRDFTCGVFSNGNFHGVDLTNARLSGAIFDYAILTEASLEGSNLQYAELAGTSLQSAILDEAKLQGASLIDANLQGARLSSAELQGAYLLQARLEGADLSFAKMEGASLYNADLRGTRLDYARLQGASLEGAQLQGANLRQAQLQGANLEESNMAYASLPQANVWRASHVDCRNTHFSELSV